MSDHARKRIGFIGGGNMAQAIVRGLLQAGHPAHLISVSDPAESQQEALKGINPELVVAGDNAALVEESDVLVLAVKPQIMGDVVEPLTALQRCEGQVIVSVAAGITLATLQNWFGNDAGLVRVMPNQPALVGEGMSGLCATPAVNAAGKALAGYTMEATGEAIWFDDEQLIDAVTAVSGSGPAYFYLVMESHGRSGRGVRL